MTDITWTNKIDGQQFTADDIAMIKEAVNSKANKDSISLLLSALNDLNIKGDETTSGNFVSGFKYMILTVGTTDYTLIGASSNAIGVIFTATGVGSGTGTAVEVLPYITDDPDNPELQGYTAEKVDALLAEISVGAPVTTVPEYKDSTGVKGQYAYSANGLTRYDCVATNTWMTSTLTDSLSLAPVVYTLTVTDPGNGDSITCSDGDLSRSLTSSILTATAVSGATISGITPVPASGREFVGWTGGLSGTDNPASLTLDGNVTISATFQSSAVVFTENFSTARSPLGGSFVAVTGMQGVEAVDGYGHGSTGSANNAEYYNQAISNNQYSQAKIVAFDSGTANQGVIVRCSTSAATFYVAVVSTTEIKVYAVSAGSWGEPLRTYTRTNSVSEVIRLEASGTTLTVRMDGTALTPTITDSSITSGMVGMYFYNPNARFDEWQGGEL